MVPNPLFFTIKSCNFLTVYENNSKSMKTVNLLRTATTLQTFAYEYLSTQVANMFLNGHFPHSLNTLMVGHISS